MKVRQTHIFDVDQRSRKAFPTEKFHSFPHGQAGIQPDPTIFNFDPEILVDDHTFYDRFSGGKFTNRNVDN